MNIPTVKKKVEDWNNHGVIQVNAKIQAVSLILLSAVFLFFQKQILLEIKAGIYIILICVIIFILSRPSKPI
mgnify:CR=1 FL=1